MLDAASDSKPRTRDSGSASQPVLFMGTQTENLDYMYELVHQLSSQLAQNQQQRAHVMHLIDTLAAQHNSSQGLVPDARPLRDIEVARQFLLQRAPANDAAAAPLPATHVAALRHQNAHLRRLLLATQRRNDAALHVLHHHQSALQTAVTLLRNEIHAYHVSVLAKSRLLFQSTLCTLEDSQFAAYLDSITDLQLLLHLSQLYRTILKLHP